MPLTLSYDDPVTAVFLRILAWELYVAKEKPLVKDATEQVQTARRELGLAPLMGGAAPAFIQQLRPKGLLSAKNTPPTPLQTQWQTEWRLLYLPPHNLVRQLSDRPVFTVEPPPRGDSTHKELLLTLRDPAVPTLRVFIGITQPKASTFYRRRGLYFLRLPRSLYMGKTDEFDVRLPQHFKRKNPIWWVFVTLEDDTHMFTLDALAAAEALLISFWNEVGVLANGTRGGDQKPAAMYLQQAVLFVEAASAALLWIIREQLSLNLPLPMLAQDGLGLLPPIPGQKGATLLPWNIPFKPFKGKNWPDCYMEVPGS